MGACGGKLTEEQRRAVEANKQIDKDIQKRQKELAKEVKLLLLGTGASGKSTIAKQMHIIYLHGFGNKDEYRQLIVINLVENMQALIKGCQRLGITVSSKSQADTILNTDPYDPQFRWSRELQDSIKALWTQDSGIQSAYNRQNEFQLSDSAAYFFNKIDNFTNMNSYSVTDEDILRARKRTTGIIETDFSIGDLNFRMVDVGGQRNERRKWIHCFEDVTAILFVGALSEYDQVLEEDESTNRMHESLHLFEETINNEWFAHTPIILFLNKDDIFVEKIKYSDLSVLFSEYKGGRNADKARQFIQDQYLVRNHSTKKERDLYVHATTATDTQNIIKVFDAVQDIFLSRALDEFTF